jgi:hypothetical protein
MAKFERGKIEDIPESTPTIVADFIRAAQEYGEPDNEELNGMKPILGREGYGQMLFERFKNERQKWHLGYESLHIKVVPKPETLYDYNFWKTVEGDALLFNDALAGLEIELRNRPGYGIASFLLTEAHILEPITKSDDPNIQGLNSEILPSTSAGLMISPRRGYTKAMATVNDPKMNRILVYEWVLESWLKLLFQLDFLEKLSQPAT